MISQRRHRNSFTRQHLRLMRIIGKQLKNHRLAKRISFASANGLVTKRNLHQVKKFVRHVKANGRRHRVTMLLNLLLKDRLVNSTKLTLRVVTLIKGRHTALTFHGMLATNNMRRTLVLRRVLMPVKDMMLRTNRMVVQLKEIKCNSELRVQLTARHVNGRRPKNIMGRLLVRQIENRHVTGALEDAKEDIIVHRINNTLQLDKNTSANRLANITNTKITIFIRNHLIISATNVRLDLRRQ